MAGLGFPANCGEFFAVLDFPSVMVTLSAAETLKYAADELERL